MKKKIKDLTLVDLTKVKNIWATPLDCLGAMDIKDLLKEYGELEVELDESNNENN